MPRRLTPAALAAVALTMGAAPATFLVAPSAHATPPTDLVISEFRVRGPNGGNDEFIEVINKGPEAHIVAASSGSGYGIAASDGTTRCSIPNGTVIPRFGHFLCANSVGYSLASYPAGNGTTASADATYTTDIPDNAGIALFDNNSGGTSYDLDHRIDAVGSTSEANRLYKEGTGYPALTPFSIDYSFYRDMRSNVAKDTNNNAADFVFVDTNGTSAGAGQRLGAPGPENLTSPVGNGGLAVTLLDPCVGMHALPNEVRGFTSDPANNSMVGTYEFRRTITNNTGGRVTRLRLRVVDISTFPQPPDLADLRLRTSGAGGVTVDRAPCGSGVSTITVPGTTLEQPPSQPNGGGLNSTMSVGVITPASPLEAGASIDIRLLAGIEHAGSSRLDIIAEAITDGTVSPPVLTSLGNGAPTALDDGPTETNEGTLVTVADPGVLANDTDPEDDQLTARLVTDTAHGVVTLSADGGYTYTPDANYVGADSFTYEAFDGTSPSAFRATVSLQVTAADDPPDPPPPPPLCAGRPATVIGTAGDDTLTGTAGADVIIAGAGHDTIIGLGGDDVFCAGAGSDRINAGPGGDQLFGGSGRDVLFAGGGDDTVAGGLGRDVLFAGEGDDSAAGGSRRDLLFAGGGDDTIAGGAGRDLEVGGLGHDRLRGGPHGDALLGGLGNDWLWGGRGIDLLDGGPGSNHLRGGPGRDRISIPTGFR